MVYLHGSHRNTMYKKISHGVGSSGAETSLRTLCTLNTFATFVRQMLCTHWAHKLNGTFDQNKTSMSILSLSTRGVIYKDANMCTSFENHGKDFLRWISTIVLLPERFFHDTHLFLSYHSISKAISNALQNITNNLQS